MLHSSRDLTLFLFYYLTEFWIGCTYCADGHINITPLFISWLQHYVERRVPENNTSWKFTKKWKNTVRNKIFDPVCTNMYTKWLSERDSLDNMDLLLTGADRDAWCGENMTCRTMCLFSIPRSEIFDYTNRHIGKGNLALMREIACFLWWIFDIWHLQSDRTSHRSANALHEACKLISLVTRLLTISKKVTTENAWQSVN